MPDLIFRWLKILIYYLNLFLGNVGIVKVLKSLVGGANGKSLFVFFLPSIIFAALGLVILLLFLTRFFKKEHRGIVRVPVKK